MSKFRQFRHRTPVLLLSVVVIAGIGVWAVPWSLAAEPGTAGAKMKLITREVSVSKIGFGAIMESLAVSPDSKRMAYAARRGDKLLVIVDGAEGKPYDGIGEGSLTFSPDSKRVAYMAKREGKWVVIVDGVEGKTYNGFLRGSRLVFDDTRSLHGLAYRGRELFRVDIRIVE